MWHIVIHTSNGRVYRETQEEEPDSGNLDYWESYYSRKDDYTFQAVVTNIFKTED